MDATLTAVRVFGKPITDGTRAQRSVAAINNPNEGGKLDHVVQVTNQSQKVGATTVSTTIGRVYNATGATVSYVTTRDWNGNVVETYPVNIENGQWAVFEHVGTRGGKDRQGSVAALVYRLQDISDFMIAWNNPWKTAQLQNNTAYCEMAEGGTFCGCAWNRIYKKLLASSSESQISMGGYSTKVTIEAGGNAPIYTAIFYTAPNSHNNLLNVI